MEDAEGLLSQAREGGQSADELQSMFELLARRLVGMQEELDALPQGSSQRSQLERRVVTLAKQVEALKEEANITEFVEDSAMAALHMSRLRGY